MSKRLGGVLLVVAAAGCLASCQVDAKKASGPLPESEQVIGNHLKDLYMAVSAAPPQSPAQQKAVQRMAEGAFNGKELMLVMRAAEGVFPATNTAAAMQLYVTVTSKMMQGATLDQLVDFARQYPVSAETARPFVQRMFELGEGVTDARAWYRIRATASRLRVADLEQQAQARALQLAAQ